MVLLELSIFEKVRFHSVVLLSLTSGALWVGFFFAQDLFFYPFLCFPTLVGKVLAKHGTGVRWMPIECLLGYLPFCGFVIISCALILWFQKPQLPSLCLCCDYLDVDSAPLCHLLKNLLTQKPGRPRRFHRGNLLKIFQIIQL